MADFSDLDYCVIAKCGMTFVVSRSPGADNIDRYIELWKSQSVSHVVRACEEVLYSPDRVIDAGIQVHNMSFPDGTIPPKDVQARWIDLVDHVFPRRGHGAQPHTAIAVHCVAGLGRAPLYVCLALILRGMDNLDAIRFVRGARHGSINSTQLEYLKSVKPRAQCLIM